jgi:hypothetical protein
MYLVASIGRAGLPYAIGALAILAVFVIVLVLKRTLTLSKGARQEENAEAHELIVRNAERAGWGPPERKRDVPAPGERRRGPEGIGNALGRASQVASCWRPPIDCGDHPHATLPAAGYSRRRDHGQSASTPGWRRRAPRGAGARRHPRAVPRRRIRLDLHGTRGALLPKLAFVKLASGSRSRGNFKPFDHPRALAAYERRRASPRSRRDRNE